MAILWNTLAVLGALFALYIAANVYLAVVLRWEDQRTVRLAYYGLPPSRRAAFKKTLRRHATLLAPLLWVSGRMTRLDFRKARVVHQGVSFPAGSCDAASLAAGTSYRPQAEDVFVATPMKCGTTWMQQVVYEVLHRGAKPVVDAGTTIYAQSPWLEGRRGVAIDQAPLHGVERPTRVIKTHFPAALCPASPAARFIYVTRHPAACFASCIDFVATNTGALAPALAAYEEWFTSPELMWWGTWTDHVRGWHERARRDGNVLTLTFEEMKADLPGVVQRVAAFLGVRPLESHELDGVVERSGFAYMKRHQDAFEMNPPHILQVNAALFVRGTADRHADVPDDARRRILAWARQGLDGGAFPVATYPDVAAAQG